MDTTWDQVQPSLAGTNVGYINASTGVWIYGDPAVHDEYLSYAAIKNNAGGVFRKGAPGAPNPEALIFAPWVPPCAIPGFSPGTVRQKLTGVALSNGDAPHNIDTAINTLDEWAKNYEASNKT